MSIYTTSIPAGRLRRPAGSTLISCGCWKERSRLTILRLQSSVLCILPLCGGDHDGSVTFSLPNGGTVWGGCHTSDFLISSATALSTITVNNPAASGGVLTLAACLHSVSVVAGQAPPALSNAKCSCKHGTKSIILTWLIARGNK